ncbi:MAG: DHHW family protein [Eubacteriales bacterium]
MRIKIKIIAVTFCFIAVTLGFMIVNIITSVDGLNSGEGRIPSAPVFSYNNLFNGKLFKECEKYSEDSFALRSKFKSLTSFVKFYVFKQKNVNSVYLANGYMSKMDFPLNEASVLNAAKKFNKIYDKFLTGMNVNYAVIPDKNYFIASENGYLSLDYAGMLDILRQNIISMNYIDLFDSLTIDSYYFTDIHWKQEKIIGAAAKLLSKMRNGFSASDIRYTVNRLFPFRGSYYGKTSFITAPDTLAYLTGSMIDDAVVYNYQSKAYSNVYEPDKFKGKDGYDVFLSGAVPLITIEIPGSTDKKELILFRDSFGSSIAPLLLEGYSKITLVDLRYIYYDILDNFIDFENQDVLFLYNTQILNNSYMFK